MDLHHYEPVWLAPGTAGFFGEGYWFHKLVPGFSLKGATFVAKTSTCYPQEGHMELTRTFRPRRFFPDCIAYDFFRARWALNAIALSNPGIKVLLEAGKWQAIDEDFFLSFMPVLEASEQVCETTEFMTILRGELPNFQQQPGLQFNITCPSVGVDLDQIMQKIETHLSILGELGIPILVKVNVLMGPELASQIASHEACAGICITNTIPFEEYLDDEVWTKLFPHGSPLKKYGGGGLSGPLLLPKTISWVSAFREIDKKTYLNAGGGIMFPKDTIDLLSAGADSVFFATVAMLRPWRVKGIIGAAHSYRRHEMEVTAVQL